MLKTFNSRLVLSAGIIALAAAFIFGATFAVFSDTETSSANTYEAGAIDLKIGNESYYNASPSAITSWAVKDLDNGELFFNFPDIKPDDEGEDTITIRVDTNHAWVCMDMDITENDGLLGDLINFTFWSDDGDNVFETGEVVLKSGPADEVLNSEIVLADSDENNVGGTIGDPLLGETEYHIAKAWCFGTLTPDPVPFGQGVNPTEASGFLCNGANLDNSSQGDLLTADIQFSAVQARNNPSFQCESDVTPTPSVSPTPTPPQIACTSVDNIYASSSSNNQQGLRKNGTAILATRVNAANAYGAPQTIGNPSDSPVTEGTFFSLGFPHANNGNVPGSIVFGFAEPFYQNPSGADLQVFEVTGGVYPDERVTVEVGPTSAGPWTAATPNPGIRDAGFEMSLVSAQYVRLTEASNLALFPNDGDGYDVDAIKAFCTQADN